MVRARLCPICKRPLDESEEALRFQPFCSKRCADIDLGRWLKGAYAIPATEAENEDGGTAEDKSGDGDEAPPVRH